MGFQYVLDAESVDRFVLRVNLNLAGTRSLRRHRASLFLSSRTLRRRCEEAEGLERGYFPFLFFALEAALNHFAATDKRAGFHA